MNNYKYNPIKMTPFKWFVLENFPFIEEDFDSLTSYGLWCKLKKYFDKVATKTNEMGTQVENLTNAFNVLKDYLDNYFDNLDVQEEINNKLDEMAESGVLSEIFKNKKVFYFKSVEELQNSEELHEGDLVFTNGYNENDNNGSSYNVVSSNDENLIPLKNNLKAKALNNSNYYENISYNKLRRNNTDYYITTIPFSDNYGEQIKPFVSHVEQNSHSTEFARKNYTSVTINASLWVGCDGAVISDGEILSDNDLSSVDNMYQYIGIKPNREIIGFQANSVTANDILNAGCTEAFLTYFKLVENGTPINFSSLDIQNETLQDIVYNKHPRQCLGIKADKTIIILTAEGRSIENDGFTAQDCANILAKLHCTNAWNLDGGGSTSTSINGIKINNNYDDNGTTDRHVNYVLSVKRNAINKDIAKAFSQIGKTKQDTNRQYNSFFNVLKYGKDISNKNLNELVGFLFFGYGNNLTNTPVASNRGYFINIPNNSYPQWLTKYNKQFFFSRDYHNIYQRVQVNGEWTEWKTLSESITHLVSDFRCYGKISLQNTYENITLTPSNSTLGNDKIEVDENNRLIIKKKGIYLISANVQYSGNGEGNRYLRLANVNENNPVDIATFSAYKQANGNCNITLIRTLTVPSDNYAIAFQMYGDINDEIPKGNVIIQPMRYDENNEF